MSHLQREGSAICAGMHRHAVTRQARYVKQAQLTGKITSHECGAGSGNQFASPSGMSGIQSPLSRTPEYLKLIEIIVTVCIFAY